MAVFSTNQVHQLYVANQVKTVADAKAAKTFGDDAKAGDIAFRTVGKGKDKEIYFLYKGADTTMKTDRIPVCNLSYAKAVAANDLRVPFKSQKVSLNGDLIAGQDYILRIELTHWVGMSENDQYFKEAAVHATSKMNAAAFYKAMVNSLNLSFSREIGATKDCNPYLDFKAEADGITITEKAQPWHLGIEAQEPVMFNAVSTTVYDGTDDVQWGTTVTTTPKVADVVPGTNGLGNGHQIADLEWFTMGERGDQYRMMGYPNYIPTQYLVDPSKEYNVLELHYAYTDEGTHSYRSEKDMTIVSADVAVINALAKAVGDAAGITIDALPATTVTGDSH